jgi:hypothetical protein
MTPSWKNNKIKQIISQGGLSVKNKILPLLSVLFILVLLAAGCGAAPLQSYVDAAKKTGQVKKGQVLVQFSHTMNFSGSGLTAEERKNLEMFKEVKGNFTQKFDRDKKLSVLDGHVDMMGMGFDLKAYGDGDRTVLMLPMFTKYLVVEAKPGAEKEPVAADTDKKLETLWKGLLNSNNVTREEGKLIATPEGEVKTTAYNVALSQPDIEGFIAGAAGIIAQDSKIRAAVLDGMVQSGLERQEAEKFLNNFFDEFESNASKVKFSEFKHTAYTDKDNYVVEEYSSSKSSYKSEDGFTVNTDFNLKIQRWAFGKDVLVEMPEVNAANSFTLKDFNENLPKMFEGLFKTGWVK